MLRSINGDSIRLSDDTQRHLLSLTGAASDHIKTRKQLSDFVNFHIGKYPAITPESRLLRGLLENVVKEYS